MRMLKNIYLGALVILLVMFTSAVSAADELVIYSARNEQLIKPLFDAYTAETGTEIKFITDKEGPLLERLKAEAMNTPADMLITVDAGNLWLAAKEGVLARVNSKVLKANIPATLLLRPFGWDTLATRVFEMTSEGQWERAALPAVTLVLAGLIPVVMLVRRSTSRI